MKIRDLLLLLGLSDLELEAHNLMRGEGSFPGDEVKMGNSDLGREGLPSRRCLFRSSCKMLCPFHFLVFSICLNYQGCHFLPRLRFPLFLLPESCPFLNSFDFLEATSYDSVLIFYQLLDVSYTIYLTLLFYLFFSALFYPV